MGHGTPAAQTARQRRRSTSPPPSTTWPPVPGGVEVPRLARAAALPRVSDQRRQAVLTAIQELDYRPSTARSRSPAPGAARSASCSTTSEPVVRRPADRSARVAPGPGATAGGGGPVPQHRPGRLAGRGIPVHARRGHRHRGEPDTDLAIPRACPSWSPAVARPSPAPTPSPRRPRRRPDGRRAPAVARAHAHRLRGRELRRLRGAADRSADRGADGRHERDARRAHEAAGAQAVGHLLDEHPDVTAVFAGTTSWRSGALSALADRGLRVPRSVRDGIRRHPARRHRVRGADEHRRRERGDRPRRRGAAVARPHRRPTAPAQETLVEPRWSPPDDPHDASRGARSSARPPGQEAGSAACCTTHACMTIAAAPRR